MRAAWVLWLSLLALACAVWLGFYVPLAASSAALVAVIAAGLWRWRSGPRWNALAAAFLVLAVAGIVWGSADQWLPNTASLYRSLERTRILLLGWALLLWLPAPPPRPSSEASAAPPSPPRAPGWLLPLACAATAGLLVLTHWAFANAAGTSGGTDEVLYLFQGELLQAGRLRAPLPDALRPFFAMVNTVPSGGLIHSQYPPGWPAVLAAFGWVGLQWWATPTMGLLAVVGTWMLGRRLIGAAGAHAAAVALLVNLHFLRWTGGYFAHAMAAAVLVWAAVLAHDSVHASGRRAWLLGVAAGVLAGSAFAARPVTALALSASIWLFVMLRPSPETGVGGHFWRRFPRLTSAMLLGSLPAALLFLAYNWATNGAPFELGYAAAHDGGHTLGFGVQQRVGYDTAGQPVRTEFVATPLAAAQKLVNFATTAAESALPAGLVLPFLWVGLRSRVRVPWRVGVFLLLPAVYFFWATATYRSLSELHPFIAVGLAWVFVGLWVREPRWTGMAAALVVAAAAVWVPARLAPARDLSRSWAGYVDRVQALGSEGPALVFVARGEASFEGLFEKLSRLNGWRRDGHLVVARDLGVRNVELIAAYPRHTPYRLTWQGARAEADEIAVTRLCPAPPQALADC